MSIRTATEPDEYRGTTPLDCPSTLVGGGRRLVAKRGKTPMSAGPKRVLIEPSELGRELRRVGYTHSTTQPNILS